MGDDPAGQRFYPPHKRTVEARPVYHLNYVHTFKLEIYKSM